MADYSTTLRTQYLEANTHVKNRITEFRFNKNTLYQSNIRLTGVGYDSVTAGEVNQYNRLVGVLSTIRACRLMDGSRELSSLRHAYQWLGFKNINATNEQVSNIHDTIHHTFQGLTYTPQGQLHTLAHPYAINAIVDPATAFNTDDLKGYVDLRIILPLLSTLPALDTTIFKNLRLVIEWENDQRLGTALDVTNKVDCSLPTLVVDEVVGDAKAKMLRNASTGSFIWNEIEHDMFQVPEGFNVGADNSRVTQNVEAVINGFDNKFVSRMLMVKSLNNKDILKGGDDGSGAVGANVAFGNGNAASIAQFEEQIQVRHQGANLFNGDGLKNDAWKQMLLQETWGVMTIPPFGALQTVGAENTSQVCQNVNGLKVSFLDGDNANEKLSQTQGQYSYIGFQIEDRVKQLQFSYTRTIAKDTAAIKYTQLALDVHIYAETRKQLVLGKNGYEVSYV